jgi:FtsH-binding integral membrane protein
MIANKEREKYMFHTSMETSAKRPRRISILAILEGLQGIVLLLGLLTVIVVASSSGTMTIEGYPIFRADASIGSALLAGMFLVVGLLSLLFAWGLWRLRRWAYWATVILQVISLVNSVIAFTQAPARVAFIVIGMINPVLLLFYLLVNPRVRAAFRT